MEWVSRAPVSASVRSDDYLISLGGEDKCVFQWKISGKEAAGNPREDTGISSLMAAGECCILMSAVS